MTRVIGNLFDINKEIDSKQVFGGHVAEGANQAVSKQLFAYRNGTGTLYSTPIEIGTANGGSGYQVASSSFYLLTRVKIIENGSVTTAPYFIGVGDTDVGFSSASPPTNATYGSTSPTQLYQGSGTFEQPIGLIIKVPALKYLYVGANHASSSCSFYIYGYELSTSATVIS